MSHYLLTITLILSPSAYGMFFDPAWQTQMQWSDNYWKKEARTRLEKVKNGWQDKSTLDEPFEDGISLLRHALHRGNDYSLAQELLETGADANKRDSVDTPLECAGSYKGVTMLLNYKADPKQCTISPLWTVFMHYSFDNRVNNISEQEWLDEELKTIGMLVDAGADANQVWYSDNSKNHPLFTIMQSSKPTKTIKRKIISYLISKGCNPNLPVEPAGNEQTVLTYCKLYEPNWHEFIQQCREQYENQQQQ